MGRGTTSGPFKSTGGFEVGAVGTNTTVVDSSGNLYQAGTQITATAAEMNALDGITATVAELNILDGVTATAAELNILDGVTATASELNYLDLTTGAGTQEASKAVVADANVNTGVSKVTELHIGASGSEVQVTATPAEINNAADVSATTQELTATGAVTAGVRSVELNHATVIIAATIADSTNHQGLFIVKDTSASGTAAHTLTLTSGTFDGTNNIATLNAPGEALVVFFDSAGNGVIVENIGAVALST